MLQTPGTTSRPGQADDPAPTARASRLALLTALYVSQFLGVGFLLVALAGILREQGVGLERIGLIQALGLGWALKFLWAPLLDRYGSRRRGHYRGWLLVLQPAIAVAILALLPFDVVTDFGLVVMIGAVVVVLSATQDIAADAIAVRILTSDDRGLANGVQVAAGYLGNVLGGGLVLIVYDTAGWVPAITLLAALTVAPLPLVLRYREAARGSDRPGLGESWVALVTIFRQPGAARWALLVMPLFFSGSAGAYAVLTPALVDAGWSLSTIGLVLNVVTSLFAIAGGVGAGLAVTRLGRRGTMVLGAALSTVAAVALVPVAAGALSVVVATAAIALFQVAYTTVSTAIYTVNMDLSRARTAGTDFTMLTSFAMVVSFVAGGLVVALAGTFGYTAMLLVCAALPVAGAALGLRSRATAGMGPDPGSPAVAK